MADRLAQRLGQIGVGEERVVGVCARRSVGTLAAVLAVLKAGGAFLPMDPADPQERLEAMIDWADPLVVLASREDRARFSIETLWPDSTADSTEEHPGAQVGGEHAACVYYTSGSSGQAKGVVLEHRAVLNQLTWVDRTLLGERPLLLPAVTRLTFAVSLKQLFVPWLRGEAVWLLNDHVAEDPAALLAALSGRPRVALNCGPHLWDAMVEAIETGRATVPGSLALLCLAGESPSQSLVDRSFAALPDLELWNLYGATETGISVAARIRPGDGLRIGEPIADVEAHVLDAELRPVAPGEVGELHIGGTGLARGYLGRPELTAERFIPHPFSDQPERRLYKTGDEARQGEDGSLEFVARSDRLLKIRGFRVEPSEVEQAITQHPAVARSAVSASRDRAGRDRLVVHVVPSDPDAAPSLPELRAFLASKIPGYMLPTRLSVLDRLPTTSSGKIDRRALPAPEEDHRPVQPGPAGPRNALEETITRVWGRALGLEQVGVMEDFFEIGGDSLAAMRVVAELESETGLRLPSSVLVEAPTPERLAKVVARSGAHHRPSDLVPLRSEGSLPPFYCVAPATGRVVALRRLASHLDSERPVYALQSFGLDDDPEAASVEAVAARYVAAIRRVQPYGPYLLGGQCRGGVIALEAAQQLAAEGDSVPVLVVIDGPPPRFQIGGKQPSRRRRQRGAKATKPKSRRSDGGRRHGKRVRRITKPIRGRMKHLDRARRRAWRRTRPLRRAVSTWLEHPLGGQSVLYFYRQRERVNKARQRYIAEPYAGRICLVSKDPRRAGTPAWEPGWRALADGGVDLLVVPARHHDVLREPAVVDVAAHVDRCLAAAQSTLVRGPDVGVPIGDTPPELADRA